MSAQYPNRSLTDIVTDPRWCTQVWPEGWQYPSARRQVSFALGNESYQRVQCEPITDDPDLDW